jgi:hypothetical protein
MQGNNDIEGNGSALEIGGDRSPAQVGQNGG